MKKGELAKLIDSFLNGTSGAWGWDDFISKPQDDPVVEQIRRTCIELPDKFPSEKANAYCNEQGLEVLRKLSRDLLKS